MKLLQRTCNNRKQNKSGSLSANQFVYIVQRSVLSLFYQVLFCQLVTLAKCFVQVWGGIFFSLVQQRFQHLKEGHDENFTSKLESLLFSSGEPTPCSKHYEKNVKVQET